MAIAVIQGPLPNDNAAVNPAIDLEAWIAATQVFGLDYTSFRGGTLQFVYSSTSIPATDARFPGMLWFKRGEGRLYIMDQNNLPSGPSNADTSVRNWLSVSDRKEIWVQAVEPVMLGQPLQVAFSASNASEHAPDGSGSENSFFDPFWRVNWDVTVMNSPEYRGTPPGQDADNNRLSDVSWVAMESADSGGVFRALEIGFCQIMMGSGATAAVGEIGINEAASNTMWYQRVSYYHAAMAQSGNTGGYIFNAFAVDPDAASQAEPWLQSAFKIPHPPFGVCK